MPSALVVGNIRARKELSGKSEFREISDARRIKDAVEVVYLMLHDARVKSSDRSIDFLAAFVKATISQVPIARHKTTHARHRETSLPVVFHLLWGDRFELGIDQHSIGYVLGVRIPWIAADAEDHDTLQDSDLRRCETRTVQCRHGVAHVLQECIQVGRRECPDGR